MTCMAGFSLSPPQGHPHSHCWNHLQPSHPIKPSASISGRNFPTTKNQGLLICLITRSPAEYMGGIGEGAIKNLCGNPASSCNSSNTLPSQQRCLFQSSCLPSRPSRIETQGLGRWLGFKSHCAPGNIHLQKLCKRSEPLGPVWKE